MTHAAINKSVADRIADLGGIDSSRVRATSASGNATIDDLLRVNSAGKPLCELVDRTLVEKVTGYEASVVAATLIRILGRFVFAHRLGLISGADGMFRLPTGDVRGPDVAFVSNERRPAGRFPSEAYPSLAPDLAVEVLSRGNTKAEMSRKRIEYFHSGVRLVWIIDCVDRSVAVYTTPSDAVVVGDQETLDGGDVVPGFSCAVADLFADLDV